jgi:mycoredoxin
MENGNEIIMYSTSWCGDCHRAKIIFRKSEVEYTDIDLDEHPEFEDIVKEINNGRRTIPTIIFPDGSILVEPSNQELREKLASL